jgi:hypothetical protein
MPARDQVMADMRVYAWLERGDVADPTARVLANRITSPRPVLTARR